MIKVERYRQIRKELLQNDLVTVEELASRHGVSKMTIRRDLKQLEEEGLATRVRGGAVSSRSRHGPLEPPMQERVKKHAEEKAEIARKAVGLIEDGETIFIGSGSTSLAVAEALQERNNLTVVTNALTVANALLNAQGVSLILVGGFLRKGETSLIGHIAERTLQDIRVDKVIMGIGGIDPQHGLTGDHIEELMTDRAVMGITDEVIIVADHTKFGHVASSLTAPVTAAKKIVTSSKAPKEIVAAVQDLGVEVIEVN